MSQPFDPYSIIGVSQTATQAQIKRAFKKRAKEAHPDKGGSAEAMAELNDAYAILTDVGKRENWDKYKSRGFATMSTEGEQIAEQQAMMTQLLIGALQKNEGRLDLVDLRQYILDELQKQRHNLDKQEKDENKKLEVFNNVRTRWVVTAGSFNYMVAAIDSQIILVENAIKACQSLREINTRVTAAVMTHKYNFDERKSPEDLYGFDKPRESPGQGQGFTVDHRFKPTLGMGFGRR